MSGLILREKAIQYACMELCECKPEDCNLTLERDGAEGCIYVEILKEVPSAEPTHEHVANTLDCVSRQAAIEAVGKHEVLFSYHLPNEFRELKDDINNLPSAEPERKKGRWEDKYIDDDHYVVCSECGDEYIENDLRLDSWVKQYFKFCPKCGADMRGDE